MPDYHAESCAIKHPEDIKQEWMNLQERADCSYFQSWGWVSTWLDQIAVNLHPIAVKVWADDSLVGLGLFVFGRIKRHSIICSNTMFLNEYPHDDKNMVIEQNGMLIARGHEKKVYEQTVVFLLKKFTEQDEFKFGAIAENESSDNLLQMRVCKARLFIDESSISWFVDLTQIPEDLDGYFASMSRNRRSQIRRSMQLYENQGTLNIFEASNAEEAMSFFDGLKKLHTQRWQSKGQSGSFANPRWEMFHRALIGNRFDNGEIQLLKVVNGSVAIGYLYNFVWRKRVYILQTGFSSSTDRRLMPGYVTHTLAILHNKSKGMSAYDLMHGDSLYKKLLCNESQKLLWVVLQRQELKFTIERLAVAMVRSLKRITGLSN